MLNHTVTAEKVALKFNGESFSFIYVLKNHLFLYFISFVPASTVLPSLLN